MSVFKVWEGWGLETWRTFRVKFYLYLFDYERFNEKGYLEDYFGLKIVWDNDLSWVFEDGSFANKRWPSAWDIHPSFSWDSEFGLRLITERDDFSRELLNKNHPEAPL